MGFNKRLGGRAMKAFLTSTRLMTKLGMLRCGKKSKVLIVVEGVTDYRVYGKIFNPATSEIVIGESKDNVVEAIKMCEQQRLKGIIGIVDADFWHTQSKLPSLPKSLFVTDYHDLECMILHSKAYEYVFLEFGDQGKLARYERQIGEKLIQWMLENVAKLGYLRKLSLEKDLDFRFSTFKLTDFVDMRTLEIIEEKMIQAILFDSRKHNQYSVKQVSRWLHEMIQPYDDLWQICCGHDLMEWLTLAFVQAIGNYNAKKLFSGQLEGNFRLSYHAKLFEETLLYKGLKDWEEGQEEYQLFMPMDEIKGI